MVVDDRELLRRYARHRSEEAFAELVRRYLSLVYHAALRNVGDPHTAEDVTQRVFLLLAQRAGRLQRHRTLAGWLHTTTRYTANETLRTDRRRRAREAQAHHMQDTATSTAWEELKPVIDEALGKLNDRDRDAVLLRYFADLPLAEVGARLNLTENTARMRVDRALQKLQGLLANHGIKSTSTALAAVLTHQAFGTVPHGLDATVTSSALVTGGARGAVQFLDRAFDFVVSQLTPAVIGAAGGLVIGGATMWAWHRDGASRSNREPMKVASAGLETPPAVGRPVSPFATRTKRPGSAKEWDPIAEGAAFLARHPAYKAALVNRSKARLATRLRPFYRSWSLAPAEVESLETLLLDGEQVSPNTPRGHLVMSPGNLRSSEDVERDIRRMLGEDGYKALVAVDRMRPARQFVANLAGALAFTTMPLPASEVDLLVEILTSARPTTFAMPYIREFDSAVVLEKSRDALNPAQFIVLGDFLRQEENDDAFKRSILQSPDFDPAAVLGPELLRISDELLDKDAGWQSQVLASRRMGLRVRYAPFVQKIGFDSVKGARFTDLLLERDQLSLDLDAAKRLAGRSAQPGVFAQIRKEAEERLRSAQANLLGHDAAAALVEFERTLPIRDLIQSFAGTATVEHLPITSMQAEQLTEAFLKASGSYGRGASADYFSLDWEAAEKAIGGILSPAQAVLYLQCEPLGGGPAWPYIRMAAVFRESLKADETRPQVTQAGDR